MSMNNPFVAFPMKMYAYETKYFASDDEFLVFFHIGRLVSARNPLIAFVNVELLHPMIQFDRTNDSRNKKRILNAILGLQSKNYIKIEQPEQDAKNTTLLTITLPHVEDSIYTSVVYSGGSKYSGFTPVTDTMFGMADTVKELKVLIYTDWRGKINYSVSYREWADVLGVSSQTAVNLIESCREKGFISKHRGDYYKADDGSIRQETNRYFVKHSVGGDWNPDKEMNTALKSMKSKQNSTETRPHKWFTKDFIVENDMYVYLTTKCDVLKEHAKSRINGVSTSPSGKEIMEKLRTKTMKKIEQHQQIRRVNEAISQENMRELIYESLDNRVEKSWTHYKERRKSDDFSHILGND